jgi:hypothetical protein
MPVQNTENTRSFSANCRKSETTCRHWLSFVDEASRTDEIAGEINGAFQYATCRSTCGHSANLLCAAFASIHDTAIPAHRTKVGLSPTSAKRNDVGEEEPTGVGCNCSCEGCFPAGSPSVSHSRSSFISSPSEGHSMGGFSNETQAAWAFMTLLTLFIASCRRCWSTGK